MFTSVSIPAVVICTMYGTINVYITMYVPSIKDNVHCTSHTK